MTLYENSKLDFHAARFYANITSLVEIEPLQVGYLSPRFKILFCQIYENDNILEKLWMESKNLICKLELMDMSESHYSSDGFKITHLYLTSNGAIMEAECGAFVKEV